MPEIKAPQMPQTLRQLCKEYAHTTSSNMYKVSTGRSDYNPLHLLMEVITKISLISLVDSKGQIVTDLRKIEEWILSHLNAWTIIDDSRSHDLDHSKRQENS